MEIKLMIMNAGGPGSSESRKESTKTLVERNNPNLVCFQEFQWHGPLNILHLNGYTFLGLSSANTGILHRTTDYQVEELSLGTLNNSLDIVRATISPTSAGISGQDFDPIKRMFAQVITCSNNQQSVKFICVSWHGWQNRIVGRGQMYMKQKRFLFRKVMDFLKDLKERLNLPLVVAGDFNIARGKVRHVITHSPFKLCRYNSSERRRNNVIDYALYSVGLTVDHLRVIEGIPVQERNGRHILIFDHDPLLGTLW